MLGDKRALATVAVKDLASARRFYEQTLGLTVSGTEGDEVVSFRADNSDLLVYRSGFAGTGKATSVTWMVGSELQAIVDRLSAKGVRFEHYDLPNTRREGHIHSSNGLRTAWFKDPDGNIHNLVDGTSRA